MAQSSSEPHSLRVATTTTTTSGSTPTPPPPILPVRSPLRPPARSISSQSDITNIDFEAIAEAAIPPEYLSLSRQQSADIINMSDGLRDSTLSGIDPHFILLADKRPDSLLSLDLEEGEGEGNSDEGRPTSTSTGRTTTTTDSSYSSAPSSASAPHSSTTAMTKRHHALHELLSSERAYASDLALIREVHIPLALGEVFFFFFFFFFNFSFLRYLRFLLLFFHVFPSLLPLASRQPPLSPVTHHLPTSLCCTDSPPSHPCTPSHPTESDDFGFFGRLS